VFPRSFGWSVSCEFSQGKMLHHLPQDLEDDRSRAGHEADERGQEKPLAGGLQSKSTGDFDKSLHGLESELFPLEVDR
jgi:hypothetical protein